MNILKNIRPSEEEKILINEKAIEVIENIQEKIDGEVIIGGSLAKDTWLKNDHDIDIFVRFNNEKDIPKLKNILKKAKVVHGSRDYYQFNKGKYNFEIVPVLKIKNVKEAKNIMDVSPLHVKWVRKNINNLNDDVRLMKAFCKANNIYGAESYIKGLSGYVLEILIIYYKGFNNLINNAKNWKYEEIIDIRGYGSANKLNKSKKGPLIVIDPVQDDRNAAAALSRKKFEKFIQLCKEYSKNPSDKYFIKQKLKLKNAVLFKIIPLRKREDIAGAKLVKAIEFIRKNLEREGFGVKDSDVLFKDNLAYIVYKNKKVDKYKEHAGPPIYKKENLENFKRAWKGYKIYKKKDFVYIKVKREHNEIKRFINSLLKDKSVKINVRKIDAKYL